MGDGDLGNHPIPLSQPRGPLHGYPLSLQAGVQAYRIVEVNKPSFAAIGQPLHSR
jgi:hypothetical protein